MARRPSEVLSGLAILLFSMPLSAGVVPPIDVTVGSAFTVAFDGAVGFPTPVSFPALSAVVRFSDFAFTDVGSNTQVTFRADISNTSEAPLTNSEVAVLGFHTSPTILRTGHSVAGVYDSVTVRDDMPFFGQVEFCLSDANNCGGVDGVGVLQGSTGTAYASLFFEGSGLRELTIDNLAVRYQGLTGVPNAFNGVGSPVPEPVAFVVLGAGIALIALRPRLYGRPS